MKALDLIIIFGYLIGIVLFGAWFGRKQKTTADYFLGDRSVPWWAVAFSIVATETSTITFISIPGVAFARGGNFGFLQLVFGYLLGRIVISLLFPALQRAKHKAQVLASPVAYVGTDNRLHLTDPTGAMEMPLTKAVAMGQCPVCHAPPAWSPSGLSVAFRMMEGGDITAVLEPFSGRVRKLPATGGVLLTWIDSNTVVQGQRSNVQVVDVHAGRPLPLRGVENDQP